MKKIILTIAILTAWRNFCERHLIGDDPYQHETLTVDELAKTSDQAPSLVREIEMRLQYNDLSFEDREILEKTLFRMTHK